MPKLRLTGITVYLPDGKTRHFKPDQVIAYGAAPTIVFATREGSKLTKYCGFPTIIHEEESTIEVPSSSLVGVV